MATAAFAPDQEVWRAAAAGESSAVTKLHQAFVPGLTSYARRRYADDPEGLANLAFYEGIRALPDLQQQNAAVFRAYTYQVVRNQVVSQYRRQRSQTLPLDDADDGSGPLSDPDPSPEDQVVSASEFRSLLSLLTEDQREVMWHRFGAGRSVAETARVLDRSPASVSNLQRRGIQRLRFLGAFALAILVGLGAYLVARLEPRVSTNSPADVPSTVPTPVGPDEGGDDIESGSSDVVGDTDRSEILTVEREGDGVTGQREDADGNRLTTPDPDGDGAPRDALDSDVDGVPDYLDPPSGTSQLPIVSEQKISDTEGGLAAALDSVDYFGTDVASIGDLDGDGITDMIVTAFGDDDGASAAGAVYVLFLNADGTVKAEQKISATAGGFGGSLVAVDQFGTAVAPIGDLDGDGLLDVAVSAHGFDDGGTDRGGLYVLFLNADGTVRAEQRISDTAGGFAATLNDSDRFGGSLSGIGDLDDDGINDLAVGATGDDDGGGNRGAVYVLFMNNDGTVKTEQKISDTIGGLAAALDDDDRFGRGITGLGDLDGDGVEDLAVSADGDDDGGTDRGAVYVLFMNTDGTIKIEQKISDLSGGLTTALDDRDDFGDAITALGDIDGDGAQDLAVGAQNDDDGGDSRGAFYILNLNTNGTVKTEAKASDTQGGFSGTLDDNDLFGSALTSLGDIDGDGTLNLAASAHFDDDGGSPNRGAVYILDLSP